MLAKLGHMPDARTTLEQLREQYPPLATRFYLAEGEILVDAGELDDAIDVYTTALNGNEEDSELRYARALVHERLQHIDAAEADLHAVLARNPNDARALNALGFMLVVHTTRLSEAEKLINHALELTPDEPAVIDSLGWLRFRQGRSTEAVNLLARAYDRFPDPEVAAHLGEALWTAGEHGKAQTVWNRALESAPDSPVLRETVKRLNP
jgi:tetratricopeptide (TPR) repeat protein